VVAKMIIATHVPKQKGPSRVAWAYTAYARYARRLEKASPTTTRLLRRIAAQARISVSSRSIPAFRSNPATTLSDRREASYSIFSVRSFSLKAIRRIP